MQHLIDHAIIANTDPVKIFGTGQFIGIVGNRVVLQIPDMIKNMLKIFFGNIPKIFFSAFLYEEQKILLIFKVQMNLSEKRN